MWTAVSLVFWRGIAWFLVRMVFWLGVVVVALANGPSGQTTPAQESGATEIITGAIGPTTAKLPQHTLAPADLVEPWRGPHKAPRRAP